MQFDDKEARTRSEIDGDRFGSGGSPDNSDHNWSEAGGPAPMLWSPRPGGSTEPTATSVQDDQRSAFHLDNGQESSTATSEQERGVVLVADKDRTIDDRGVGAQTATPRGRGVGSNADARGHARKASDVVHVLPRGGTHRPAFSLREHKTNEEDTSPIRASAAKALEQHGSNLGAHHGPSKGMLEPDGYVWEGAGPADNASENPTDEARSVSEAGETGNSEGHEQQTSRRRSSRVVTVSVKSKSNHEQLSDSPLDEGSGGLPQLQVWHAADTNNARDPVSPRRKHGIHSSEASPIMPGFAAAHSGTPSEEMTVGQDNGRTFSGVGSANGEGKQLARGQVRIGAEKEENTLSGIGPDSPVVAASRLGLEGDGFPDISEFDLDDISEIDAGGEWTASEGRESLSS